MRKRLLLVGILVVILGLILASVSISEYLHIQKAGLEEASFCTINEKINCDVVNASSYSKFFGIPVAAWGWLFYLTNLLFLIYLKSSKNPKEAIFNFVWAFSVFGVLWNIRMAYVSVVVLNAICLTCLSQYIVSLLLAVIMVFASSSSLKDRLSNLFSKKIFSPALTTLIIFIIGYVFSLSAFSNKMEKITSADVKEYVNSYFRQSLYDINPDDLKGSPTWGNKDAKVTIVEFSDFQCPFCRIAAFNIRPYLQEYRDNVKFVYKYYPLDNSCNKYLEAPMHPNACLAAKTAVCAHQKGKFGEIHDAIFKDQGKISKEMLLGLAEKNGIEKGWMETCIASPETQATLEKDIELAHHIYLSGTPSVIVNKRMLKFWKIPEFLRAVIEEEIKRAK